MDEVQQDQVSGSALSSQQLQAMLQYLSRMAGKLCSRKGSMCVGQYLADHKPAACPDGQEGQLCPGMYQK